MVCQMVEEQTSSAAVSPTTLAFTNLDPRTYDVAVTNASRYLDASEIISAILGMTSADTIALHPAAVTPTPTQAGAATPIVAKTVAPTNPSSRASSGETAATLATGGQPAPRVVALPNTGAGHAGSSASISVMLLAMLLVIGSGGLAWRRRQP